MAEHLMQTLDAQFDKLYAQIKTLKEELDLWRNMALSADTAGKYHTHESSERLGGSGWFYAVCGTCGKDMGWWCEDSPTHTCDYRQDDGSYDEDRCRHCGEPEERK